MENGINVVSFFDGMSCGQIALERAKIKVDKYYACEIEPKSITVTQHNYPNTIQLGDVRNVHCSNHGVEVDINESEAKIYGCGDVHLLLGGSPCQDISNLNQFQQGLDGIKSGLFYQYWRMWQEILKCNPKAYFLLENVAGNKSAIASITKLMGKRPIKISSNWVSAQNRMRYYWTNIPVKTVPTKKNIHLKDILQSNVDEKYFLKDGRLKWLIGESGSKSVKKRFTGIDPIKAGCLTVRGEKSWNTTYVTDNGRLRTLTPTEYEILQTVPIGYTSIVDDSAAYEMLGNGWTVDIIAWILSHLPNEFKKQNNAIN
jgi:site-specific DNA-cytosine methylase